MVLVDRRRGGGGAGRRGEPALAVWTRVVPNVVVRVDVINIAARPDRIDYST